MFPLSIYDRRELCVVWVCLDDRFIRWADWITRSGFLNAINRSKVKMSDKLLLYYQFFIHKRPFSMERELSKSILFVKKTVFQGMKIFL